MRRKPLLRHEPRPRKTGKAGRPTVYSRKLAQVIASSYSDGLGFTDACGVAQISVATGKRWLKESKENPDGPLGDFEPLIRHAKTAAILKAAAEAKKMDPKWWLARMRPQRFGDPARRLRLLPPPKPPSGPPLVPSVQVELGKLTNKELADELRARAEVLDQLDNEQDSSADCPRNEQPAEEAE